MSDNPLNPGDRVRFVKEPDILSPSDPVDERATVTGVETEEIFISDEPREQTTIDLELESGETRTARPETVSDEVPDDLTGIAVQPLSQGLDPVGFERQEPTGKFAPKNTRPDGTVPPDRGPNGRFVSPDREPIEDIGRKRNDGLFDLF